MKTQFIFLLILLSALELVAQTKSSDVTPGKINVFGSTLKLG